MMVADQLLNSSVLNRMVNSSLYGNTYSLSAYFKDLHDAMFKVDKNKPVNSFRQNLQVAFVKKFIGLAKVKNLHAMIQAQVYSQLNKISREMKNSKSSGISTNRHRDYVAFLIQKYFEE
jgi:hypothetical protein